MDSVTYLLHSFQTQKGTPTVEHRITLPAPFSNPSAVITGCLPCSRHGNSGFAPAVPLTSTLDEHHGAKTQKEINLALWAV